jgi:hypothetical protein
MTWGLPAHGEEIGIEPRQEISSENCGENGTTDGGSGTSIHLLSWVIRRSRKRTEPNGD